MSLLKPIPKPIGPKPTLPSLAEKLDRLQQLQAQVVALRVEIEQDMIEASRADTRRFEIIRASRVINEAKHDSKPKSLGPKSPNTPRKGRQASWMKDLGL